MGDDFWKYSAFGFNCQRQQNNLLKSNGLLTSAIDAFIFQEPKGILQELPAHMAPSADFITDLGAIFRKLTGKGDIAGEASSPVKPVDIQIKNKGGLKRLGYTAKDPFETRRKALQKAIDEYGHKKTIKMLTAIENLQKTRSPATSAIFGEDAKWVKEDEMTQFDDNSNTVDYPNRV